MNFRNLAVGAIASCFGLMAASTAEPADRIMNVELTPYGAYRLGGTFDVADTETTYDLADASSYGLIVNFRHQGNTQWEILYSHQQTDAEFSDSSSGNALVDVDIDVLQGGGTYQGDGDTVRPYLTLTAGGTRIGTSTAGTSKSDTFWSASIGVGLQIRPTERIGLRLEARAYGTLLDADSDIFCQTGPDQNICAVQIHGTLLKQFETLAGIVFRF